MTTIQRLKDFYYVFSSYTDPGMPAFAIVVEFTTDDIATMDAPPFNGQRRFERQLNVQQAQDLGFNLEAICEHLTTDVAARLEQSADEIAGLKADREKAEGDLVEERQAKAQVLHEREVAVAGLQSEIEELRATIAELEAQVKEEQAATASVVADMGKELDARG